MPELETFNPVAYSLEENKFFMEHLGEPPVAVLNDALPAGVNPREVSRVLGTIYDYQQLEQHRGVTWCGIAPIRKAIETWLREWTKATEAHRRGGPRWPSMHAWDARGRHFKGGVGSDANVVSTWIDSKGERHPLEVKFREGQLSDFVPDWLVNQVETPRALIEDEAKGKLECPICSYATNYNPESRSTRSLAMGRMSRHCTQARKEPDLHRQLKMEVFG